MCVRVCTILILLTPNSAHAPSWDALRRDGTSAVFPNSREIDQASKPRVPTTPRGDASRATTHRYVFLRPELVCICDLDANTCFTSRLVFDRVTLKCWFTVYYCLRSSPCSIFCFLVVQCCVYVPGARRAYFTVCFNCHETDAAALTRSCYKCPHGGGMQDAPPPRNRMKIY